MVEDANAVILTFGSYRLGVSMLFMVLVRFGELNCFLETML